MNAKAPLILEDAEDIGNTAVRLTFPDTPRYPDGAGVVVDVAPNGMGPSPERNLDSAIHNFGHRAEATMTQVYGSWEQNKTAHDWERFALVKALSPDYDYGNPSTVLSNCDDFANYPDLGNPADTVEPVTCSIWSCDHIGYLAYRFGHLPSNTGCGSDGVTSSRRKSFLDPALALDPAAPCD